MRRVLTAREQVAMLSPWRTATTWYHVSPHRLEPGTDVIPGAAEGPWSQAYPDRRSQAWVTDESQLDTWKNQLRWHLNDPLKPAYLYEVEPSKTPVQHGSEGWTTPSARVKGQVEEFY